jgi:uncharacterized membrane protein HdeD (DUF308 family)
MHMTAMERQGARMQAELELPLRWGWVLALGLLSIILGASGIVFVVAFTLASVLVFGALALIAGGLLLWHGLSRDGRRWSGRALQLFLGMAYLVLGGLLLWDPVSGSISLTLLLAAFLVAVGISRLAYAWKCRRQHWRWKLALAGGLIDLLLAGVIFYGWPGTGLWVIGLFVAIELLLNGWFLAAVALAARSAERAQGGSVSGGTAHSDSRVHGA